MKQARWWLGIAFLGFGLAAVGNWTSAKWIAVTLALYSIPLLCQLLPSRTLRVYGLWFGAFLVLQTLATALVVDRDYVTLPPNLSQTIDVRGDAIPGIAGQQSISTDEQGFRVTRPIAYGEKADGAFRIFAIGGSTTEQILLDDRRTWTHLLQEKLAASSGIEQIEVINTGVSGTRARQHLATLKRIARWQPDAVIFLLGINDWNRAIWDEFGEPERRNPGELQSPIQFSGTLLGNALMAINAAGTEPDDTVRPEYGEYYSTQNDSLRRPDRRSFRPDAVSESYATVLDEIAGVCAQYGIACLFISQPTAYSPAAPEEVKRHFWMTPPNTRYTLDLDSLWHVSSLYNRFLMDFAEERSLPRCDLAAQIGPTRDVFYDECHFNERGAAHVAALLAECIGEQLATLLANPESE